MVIGHHQHQSSEHHYGHSSDSHDVELVQTIGPETHGRFRDPEVQHMHIKANPQSEPHAIMPRSKLHADHPHAIDYPNNDNAAMHSRPEEVSEEHSRGQSSNNTDDSLKVKKINVTTVGPFPKQKQFVCNRFVKSYSRFLDEIRERLGCDQSIRCLKSPGGTRVRSLENLRGNNTTYTALCPNDMIRQTLGPLTHLPPPPLRPVRRLQHGWIPRSNIYNYVPSRVMDQNNYRCRCIHVFLNGDFHRRPHRILIDRKIESTSRPFELLLKYAEEKCVTKDTRPCVVRKLYDLNTGRPVTDINEIEDGMTLVACPNFERLILGSYGRVDRPMNCGKPPSSKKKAFLSKTPTPPEGKQRPGGPSNDSSPRHVELDLRQMNPLAPLPPISKRPPRSEPTPHTTRTYEPLQDDFKAQKPQTASDGAQEIPDTSETVTDLPVEKREAEQIEEEDVEPPPARQPTEEEIPRRPFRRRVTSPSDDRYEDLSEEKTDQTIDDEEAKRIAAATTVQAGYRGYQTRKNLADQKNAEESPAKPVVQKQAEMEEQEIEEDQLEESLEKAEDNVPKEEEVKEEEQPEKDDKADDKQAEAAIKIQAGYRGYKTRKEIKSNKDEKTEKKDEPKEDKIEEAAEKKEDKAESSGPSAEDKAATTIQAGYRGYKTRKDLKSQADEEEKDEKDEPKTEEPPQEVKQPEEEGESQDDEEKKRVEAATKIQAGYRGYQTRQQLKDNATAKEDKPQEEPKPEEDAKETQQDDNKDDDEQRKAEAATKIQAGYRGYQTRSQLKKQQDTPQEPASEESAKANGVDEEGTEAPPPPAEEASKDSEKANGAEVSQGSAA